MNVSEHLRQILHTEFPTRRERVAVLTITARHLAGTGVMEPVKLTPGAPAPPLSPPTMSTCIS